MGNDHSIPAIVPPWLGPSTLTGPFRTPQSFTLIAADHLLCKLGWDMGLLESMQWDEDLDDMWRQAVSFKAVDCATSIWHLGEWFARDIQGSEPRERACAFLGVHGHDPHQPIPVPELRKHAIAKCPDLEICRVIAIASKHYEIENKPRPDIWTRCVLAMARRSGESFQRPIMQLTVIENRQERNMWDVLVGCQAFWNQFWEVAKPGSNWKPPTIASG